MNKPNLALREDNILELYRDNGQFYQINLNNVSFIMIEKNEKLFEVIISGMHELQIPIEYYEGFITLIKESKLFEIHKQNYYNLVTTSEGEKEKQHLDDLFVNVKSKDILLTIEEPKYLDGDTEKFIINVIDKGSVFFFREEDNG